MRLDIQRNTCLLLTTKKLLSPLLLALLISFITVCSGCTGNTASGVVPSHPTSVASSLAAPVVVPNIATPSASLIHSSGKSVTSSIPPFDTITMIDATTGWASTEPNFPGTPSYPTAILRTTDGGDHWNDVTPEIIGGSLEGGTQYFLNTTTAWVAISQGTTQVYRTTDGGQSWQETVIVSPLQAARATQLTFIDPLTGWLILTATDTGGDDVAILRTTDEGKTWAEIASTSPGSSIGHLPFGNSLWGVTFLNRSTGWATSEISGLTTLLKTENGGLSWETQSLMLPFYTSTIATLPPSFFNAQDGVLPVLFFSSSQRGVDLFITHNGGNSWTGTTPLMMSVSVAADLLTTTKTMQFSDINHGWAVDANGTPLYATNDGGKHWTAISSTNYKSLDAINFVSDTMAWAIDRPDHDSSFLLKTEDGGRSWNVVFSTHLPTP